MVICSLSSYTLGRLLSKGPINNDSDLASRIVITCANPPPRLGSRHPSNLGKPSQSRLIMLLEALPPLAVAANHKNKIGRSTTRDKKLQVVRGEQTLLLQNCHELHTNSADLVGDVQPHPPFSSTAHHFLITGPHAG